jgi:hypothetical protein
MDGADMGEVAQYQELTLMIRIPSLAPSSTSQFFLHHNTHAGSTLPAEQPIVLQTLNPQNRPLHVICMCLGALGGSQLSDPPR